MKILLATDGSACSENAVSAISHRTLVPATEIRLITVIPAIEADALAGASLPILDGLIAAQHDEAARKLNVAIAQLKESRPNVIITSTTREGLPEEVILDEARRWHADLIVVG